ncbi:MAG TPA: hypothetical protein VH277_16420 [Gemmatimonadaceae bacterium]|jgi:hypothetical protein|nr:hypothetical protein [Gemmatimonadaceae bacterium]
MTEYEFPLASTRFLVERIDGDVDGPRRRWVLRDDNQQHYHGRVPLNEDPLLLELHWKADAHGREQTVGLFQLHVGELLKANYVRLESDSPREADVRLRFYRGDRGVVYIQASAAQPALPIGVVDRALA